MHLPLITLVLATSAIAMPAVPSATPTLIDHLHGPQVSSTSVPVPTGNFITIQYVTIPGVTNSYVNVPAKAIDISIPTCVQTIKPDANGYVPPGECGAPWNYYPNFAAAMVFAVLFGILTAVHIRQAAIHEKRWCWVIIMASIWETLAFAFRALSSKSQQSTGILFVFQVFILLAPLWVNAFAYMTLGRMIHFFHPSRSLLRIPDSTFAAIFVGLDVISFIIQLIGGTRAGPTTPPEEQMRALHIYMGGIGLQEFFIVIFVGLALVFQRDMRRAGLVGNQSHAWRPLSWALYFSLGMVTIRIIYRLVEFSSGHGVDNKLIAHEVYSYVLEAVTVLFAIAVFNVVHPGPIMKGPGSEMPGLFATVKSALARRKGSLPLKQSASEQELRDNMRSQRI